MKKILGIILILTIVSMCSCTTKETTKKTTAFTERQKQILAQKGLNPNTLDSWETNKIMVIEDLLTYLENEHNDTFEYIEYIENDNPHITARCSIGVVTAYKRYEAGEPIYWDNYSEVLIEPKYRQEVSNWLTNTEEDGRCTFFIDIKRVTNENASPMASAWVSIDFVFDSMTEDNFDNIVLKYSEWAKEQAKGNYCWLKFVLLKENNLTEYYESNYKEKIVKEAAKTYTCIINESGSIKLTKEQ